MGNYNLLLKEKKKTSHNLKDKCKGDGPEEL